jgi:transcription elongation factor Elf1
VLRGHPRAMTLSAQTKRSYASAFKCPRCEHENRHPVVTETPAGTPVAICDDCGTEVSRRLIADAQDRYERARRKAINDWAGWGTDVV